MKKFELTRPPSSDDLISSSGRYNGFWRQIFLQAHHTKASDIHVEAHYPGLLIVLLRIDGERKEVARRESIDEVENLILTLKNISNLDTSTRRYRQDGAFELNLTKSNYRVTLSPGYGFGERLVFRISRSEEIPTLNQLGLSEEAQKDIEWAVSQSQGFILVTGPTGSGKSTTVRATLMQVDREAKNVVTLEDPVEQYVERVNHQVMTTEFGWDEASKGVLRQDPDVIFFGEIRDEISAEYAVQAAQTGHLVISTLHTNSVVDTVNRLLTLNVKDYLIADSLLFISAQRLFQKLCVSCRVPYNGFYKRNTAGCPLCIRGYKGRVSVVEYCVAPDPELILNFRKDEFHKILKQTALGELEIKAKAGLIDYPSFENALRKGGF